jgi:cobalt/nickel transport system ATP-binding protein
MSLVLEVNHFRFAYSSETPVFQDLSFSIQAGECVGLVGGNGSGKSTLIWCLLGLLKADGELRLFDTRWNKKLLHRIGVVFQNPEDQLFMPTVLEDLKLTWMQEKIPSTEAARRARLLLNLAGLEGIEDRSCSQLSMGERKRAAIAAALARTPELLLLDEPTAELDGRATRELAGVLDRLTITRLIASHDLAFLEKLADRLIVLGNGKILAAGDTASILSNHALLEQAGLI